MKLVHVALGITLLAAGCLGTGPTTSPTDPGPTDRTPTDPGPTEAPAPLAACPDEVERIAVGSDDTTLPAADGGFTLRANRSVVARGDGISFELTNAASRERHTGTHRKYLLQRRAPDGWATVVGFPAGRSGWNATAVSHPPGAGFAWRFTASPAGFSTSTYEVCGPLPAGQYRFVYFGGPDDDDVAVRFRLAA